MAKYVDTIVIDNYNDRLELNQNIKEIDQLCKEDSDLDRKIEIHLRKQHENLSSRGGQTPNKKKIRERDYPCGPIFSEMAVRPNGEVSLCCNEALGTVTLGDLNVQRVDEV